MPAATKGFLDRVLVKSVMYEELSGVQGNPFRNLMTNLSGVSALTVHDSQRQSTSSWAAISREHLSGDGMAETR